MSAEQTNSFDAFLLLVGKLNYAWTNTESLLIHLISGLARVDMETATVIFLTLNTSRARIDLVQRMAKLGRVAAAERKAILGVTERVQKAGQLRNRYNHCIYAFDSNAEVSHTILMRIADRKDAIKMGQTQAVDVAAVAGIDGAIAELRDINHTIWGLIREYAYPS
ncbi:hypothetical protein [Yoonia sp.]|uniref:hypothetical protein n=1 Tax=Yoonia sp. TaxID=2212373 RepID=UPI0025F5E04C|nr:hypothetical protein [Yoonia sp.]